MNRHEIECIYVFNNKDLRGANLTGVDLSGADLRFANLTGVNLRFANLTGANLTDVNLRCANLTGANLTDVDLRFANLRKTIGDGRRIKTIQTEYYIVNIYDDRMQIGCKNYSIDEWYSFDDNEINDMDENALEFWNKYKDKIEVWL